MSSNQVLIFSFFKSDFLMQKNEKRIQVKPVETAFIVTKIILTVLLQPPLNKSSKHPLSFTPAESHQKILF